LIRKKGVECSFEHSNT